MSLKPSENTKSPRSSVEHVGPSDSLQPTSITLSPCLDEATFLAHYDWLIKWASRLVLGTREDPEDLVQDLYVSMIMVRVSPKPTFGDDDQIRAYLYKSLKNLFLSRLRRQRKDLVSGYPTVYFDSMEFAIAAADTSSLHFVRSELAAICEYACMRRKNSRVGSAFIFRYFLGYTPDEIIALLRWSRAQVHTNCETGRLEARAYLERPHILRFLNEVDRSAYSFPRELPQETAALFDELTKRIFSLAEGRCFAPFELKEHYQKGSGGVYDTNQIAHLASCKYCLKQASTTSKVTAAAL